MTKLPKNPFQENEDWQSWLENDSFYLRSKKQSFQKYINSFPTKNNFFMSIQEKYLQTVHFITKNAVLATVIMIIAITTVGAVAAELVAPQEFKPSNLFRKENTNGTNTQNFYKTDLKTDKYDISVLYFKDEMRLTYGGNLQNNDRCNYVSLEEMNKENDNFILNFEVKKQLDNTKCQAQISPLQVSGEAKIELNSNQLTDFNKIFTINLNGLEISSGSSSSANPIQSLKADENYDVVVLNECDLAIKIPKKYSSSFTTKIQDDTKRYKEFNSMPEIPKTFLLQYLAITSQEPQMSEYYFRGISCFDKTDYKLENVEGQVTNQIITETKDYNFELLNFKDLKVRNIIKHVPCCGIDNQGQKNYIFNHSGKTIIVSDIFPNYEKEDKYNLILQPNSLAPSTPSVSLEDGKSSSSSSTIINQGKVFGLLTYPSESLNEVNACAENIDTKETKCTERKNGNNQSFEILLNDGKYTVYSTSGNDSYRAYYDEAVICGNGFPTYECTQKIPDPKPVIVEIKNGNSLEVKPWNWYKTNQNQQSSIPSQNQTYTNEFYPDLNIKYDNSWTIKNETYPTNYAGLLGRQITLSKNGTDIIFVISPKFTALDSCITDAPAPIPSITQVGKYHRYSTYQFIYWYQSYSMGNKCPNDFILKSTLLSKNYKNAGYEYDEQFVESMVSVEVIRATNPERLAEAEEIIKNSVFSSNK
jgi:hypothetical protein